MGKIEEYRFGGEGFVKWCRNEVCIPVYTRNSVLPVWTPISDLPDWPDPETLRSPKSFWDNMCTVVREALAVNEIGQFNHRLIVFCWERGEGKSLLTCLVQLWKFYNFPAQLIALGANSRDQVKFVHFDIMRDIILNSPKLLRITGRKNIQEKEIRLRDQDGIVKSTIRSISSFSGIVSNITGYTFSEIFDLKNPKFFYQLDGSIRNIPNALGIIDTTVSGKEHILFRLYKLWLEKKDPTLFFSHRSSPEADYRDFWHPAMTQQQLDSYQAKFPAQEFNQYFRNTWSAGSHHLIEPELVLASNIIGYDKSLGMQGAVINALKTYVKSKNTIARLRNLDLKRRGKSMAIEDLEGRIRAATTPLRKVSDVYQLCDGETPRMATKQELEALTRLYDTDWAILVGLDRSDPLKRVSGARTILVAMAKGLPGSRSDPSMMLNLGVHSYVYFILHLAHIASAGMEDIKLELSCVHSEYDGIDVVGGERWGLWDLATWCEDNEILFIPINPTTNRQKEAFTELYQLYKGGMIKVPQIKVPGVRGRDILKEEVLNFDYNPRKGTYGSPNKHEKYGIQDDSVFALGWGVWSGKNFTVENFRPRSSNMVFGEFFREPVYGKY
ncbi:MAG: hypothetical protein EHM49_00255 [Deltaproteobacteria bacterium]|nr:MAG: hypothetical protein EHM49_00255 [Deltaproteobacteria bacterium]